MISIVKSDGEFDAKPAAAEDNRSDVRVSGDGANSPCEEKPRVSGVELDSRAPESEANARVLENNVFAEEIKAMARVGEESDVDKEMEEESRVFEVKDEKIPSFVQFDLQHDRFDPRHDEFDDNDHIGHARGDSKVEVYKTLLSEFEDFVANETHEAMAGTCRALSYGFEVGDMIWGKVKSHPWWPGHIFNEAFASSSVRRTRREGYVLVAFFGDSSYGWFDPAELIPFDPHFAEKSQETNSRNFVKAVEEAVDEACRRRGLGLACRCRNRYNFRLTNVQGYFEVDVPDYEPRGVYSEDQIKKYREAFQPVETLAFVKQLALAPNACDRSTINFMKNKATVFALRRAVFEEFDETYAQAFGVHTKRPANDPANLSDQPNKNPTRAPLSGPLVIAEALGGVKSSKKLVKVKDQSKKDRYLIKRRDELVDVKALQIGQKQASISDPAAYEEGSSAVVTVDYVLQKRAPTFTSAKHENTGNFGSEGAGPSEDVFSKAVISDQDPAYAQVTQCTILNAIASPIKETDALLEKEDKLSPDMVVDPTSRSDISVEGVPLGAIVDFSPSFQQEVDAMFDNRCEYSAKVSQLNEGSQLTENFSARSEGGGGLDKLKVARLGSNLSTPDPKHSIGLVADFGVKKAKVHKRPLGDLTSSIIREKKKKMKKKLYAETNPDELKKRLALRTGGAMVGNSVGKSTISAAPREDAWVNPQKKDGGTSNALFTGVGTSSMVGAGSMELEVQHLLNNLHALALDPFHGAERNVPSITMQFFLRFRSLYYQKSLELSPPSEIESTEIRAKSSSFVGVSENSAGENVRDLTSSKLMKSLVRTDDPTKGGWKRLPSDRQEEIAAKRLKKINHLKSLGAEKKAGQRMETQRTEGKEPVPAAPARPVKSDILRKTEPHTRPVEPTMLVMKFPPSTSLPSVAELKARFARFGSIDQSAIRVFWQSSTCRVVFRHKLDAQAAYKYAVGNNSLFGIVNVRYSLREVGAPASEAPESDKGRGDDTSPEAPRVKDPAVGRPRLMHQPLPQSTIQPRSILKKPTGDEAGQVTGGRGTARVKFMLGGEETSREEQLMVGNRNFNNNASFAEGGAPTSVAMDFNSKNFQKVIPPSPSPILPLPSQFAKAQMNNSHHTEVAPRNLPKMNSSPITPLSAPSIDISQQMLSLLTRCNDVVTTVTGLLGYVPYHPL